MDQMARDFVDQAHFLFVYTREAHPDKFPEHPAHRSFEQKTQHARDMQQRHNTPRAILVDTLDGEVHLLYGGMPNMSWIVDHTGIVAFKASWTDAPDIRAALAETLRVRELRREGGGSPYYREMVGLRRERPRDESQ